MGADISDLNFAHGGYEYQVIKNEVTGNEAADACKAKGKLSFII